LSFLTRRSDSTIVAINPSRKNWLEVSCLWKRTRAKGNNIKALKGKLAGSYRYRVGDLRIVYTINDQAVTEFVITIAKRGDVYD
jgi:mRNA-degrading endonuclease RelE of RelBE toxin-antitoxin system